MLSKPKLCASVLQHISRDLPPTYLAPSLVSSHVQQGSFSTTTPLPKRRAQRRKGNPERGVSALRRTGLRQKVGMSKEPLPKPVLDPDRKPKISIDPNHGLWGFFNKDKKTLTLPTEEVAHGRPWNSTELRHKSWEDVHSLWWKCVKERNRLATEKEERKRLGIEVGDVEAHGREMVVRRTQRNIKMALTERWYAWEDAWKLAEQDEEVDLEAEPGTTAYRPVMHEEDSEMDEADMEEPPRAASAAA